MLTHKIHFLLVITLNNYLLDYVKPIALASEELEAGMGVTVSGFGFTSDGKHVQVISNFDHKIYFNSR
jgi:hypothetical protein